MVDAFLDGRFSVATTEHLWSGVLRALSYDRVKRLFERGGIAAPDARVALLGPLLVVQCALTARAERIVSGDRALLAIQAVEKVTILTARQFLADLGIVVP